MRVQACLKNVQCTLYLFLRSLLWLCLGLRVFNIDFPHSRFGGREQRSLDWLELGHKLKCEGAMWFWMVL